MNKDDFTIKLNRIKAVYENSKKELRREYAISNNSHNIGDIVKSSSSIIKIDKILIGKVFDSELSECVYIGYELRKDFVPKKSGAKDTIWQSMVITNKDGKQ